jgi:hypothetical protein
MAWLRFRVVASALVSWGVSIVEARSRRGDRSMERWQAVAAVVFGRLLVTDATSSTAFGLLGGPDRVYSRGAAASCMSRGLQPRVAFAGVER